MTPVHQQLLEEIERTLRGICRPAGYNTDMVRVFSFRDPANEPIQREELPCITFREMPGQSQPLTATVHRHSFTLDISGHVADSIEAPARLRDLGADISKAFAIDPTFTGLAQFCQPSGSQMNTERRGHNVGTVTLQYEVRYQTKANDPNTLHEAPVDES